MDTIKAVVRKCSVKKVLLKISQNPHENTCARVSFLIKLQALDFQLYLKIGSGTCVFLWILGIFKNTFFIEYLLWLLLAAGTKRLKIKKVAANVFPDTSVLHLNSSNSCVEICDKQNIFTINSPAGIYLFEVSIRTMCENCSKSTIMSSGQCQWPKYCKIC